MTNVLSKALFNYGLVDCCPVCQHPHEPIKDGGRYVLVIDDEELIRVCVAEMLHGEGFACLTARNGAVGWQIIQAHAASINCVVLDGVMPCMDGEATFELIRKTHPEIPTILVTGVYDMERVSAMRSKGLAGSLGKPFRADDLVALVRQVTGTPPGG